MVKYLIKKFLLKFQKSILLEKGAQVNYNIINYGKGSLYPCKIANSETSLTSVDEGCNIVDSKTYGDVRLGRFVTITGPGTIIKALKEFISIGSFTSIGQNVCVIDFNHNCDRITSSFINHLVYGEHFSNDIITKGPIVIEEDVFIGSNTLILPGVTIGRGSIIGGGSIVTSDIPKYSISFGNPARVIKKRFTDEIIELLEELKWWEWDIGKLNRNKILFNSDLNSLSLPEIKSIIKT